MRRIFREHFAVKLLCELSMCVLIAQTLHPALGARRDLSLRRGVLKLWVCGIFIEFFFATTDSCGDPATFLSTFLSEREDLVEILVGSSLRGPCVKILQMPCLRGACVKALVEGSWEVLVSRSCAIRSSSSRSFYDDLVRFVSGSWPTSCTIPCEKILWRSW